MSKEKEKKQKEVNDNLNGGAVDMELEDCKKQKDEYLAGWQRERADFLNYKKEEIERIGSLVSYAKEEMVMNFLPILDNFDLAERNLSEDSKNDQNVRGLLLIKKQIEDFLKGLGVERINCENGCLDPEVHEIIEEIEIKNKKPGEIIEEVQRGYKMNGKLLRPAKVKIAK